MLSDTASEDPRELDKAAAWLVERAASSLPTLAESLFQDAFLLWGARSFVRYSDDEPCCAVVFFDCCEQVLTSREPTVMRVSYESQQPTREMRAGLAHPKSAPRPDMNIIFGPFTVTIEAKRLMLGAGLPREYVKEGMRRFIDGKYSSTPRKIGFMLGFVVGDSTAEIFIAINRAILRESDLGANDQLAPIATPISRLSRCESRHVNDLRLLHNFFDLT